MRRGEENWNIGFEVISKRSNELSDILEDITWGSENLGNKGFKQSKIIRIYFTQTDRETGEVKELDYKIRLESTPCNYWGFRYWFICPCGWDRCGTLFLQSNWIFASRKTLWITYEDQNQRRKWREFNNVYPMYHQAEELKKTIKYKFRSGKITRKYKRYLKLMRYWVPAEKRTETILRILKNP